MYSWGVGTPQSDPNLKKNFFFDQSTSVIFNSSVSVLCSLCRGHKGIWDATFFSFSLSPSLWMCVLHMCEYSWFQKHALFYFLSFTVGNWVCCTHCWLSPQHLLPSPLLSSPWFPFGDLGFQRCWFYFHFQILSLFCWKVLPLILPFLIQSKKQQQKTTKLSYWGCKAWCSGALLLQPHLLQSPTHLSSFLLPLLLFLKHSRHCCICQYSPTSRTLTLWSVRIKQLKTELTSFP